MNPAVNDCALLVLSCDRYDDAWSPFFALFRKYWPGCRFPVFLGTNELNPSISDVQVLRSGKAADWSTDTRKIVEQLNKKYILILLEDYFLINPVNTKMLEQCLHVTRECDAAFTRIASFRADHFPMYAFDAMKDHPEMGITRAHVPFRINLQAGIWNKQDLLALLKDGESPWEFEVNGSHRSHKMNRTFLGITEASTQDILAGPIPYLCTAITKGIWMREALELCRREHVALDVSKRPTETRSAYTWRKIYHGLSYPNRKYVDFLASKFKGH